MYPSSIRVAAKFVGAKGPAKLVGAARLEFLDEVWAMYAKTYARIGLHIPNPQGLLKYGLWEIVFDGDEPVAFGLFKVTSFGLKSGLSGHDFSSAGKRAAIDGIRRKFKEDGTYGEVSHKVKSIVLASGAPVVCANLAGDVIGKKVKAIDPITYERVLRGVGKVQKSLVGKPRGIQTTSPNNPVCPVNFKDPDPEPLKDLTAISGLTRQAFGVLSSFDDDWGDDDDLCAHLSEEAMSSLI